MTTEARRELWQSISLNYKIEDFMHFLYPRLTTAEATVYALIYAFSQKEGSFYYGGTELLSESCFMSERNARRILNKLLAYKLIEKVKTPERSGYRTNKAATDLAARAFYTAVIEKTKRQLVCQ